ncbi:MAG: heat-shock protein HtpX [Nitrospira sp. HN-bin3]|jgi:heat shock protein HtpX|uniref:protease HtpX n=1 Tax=Nitrospira cf. moscoviensis SBR1015 TaxID=96242 RepID=UPI000A0BF4A0|nr:protease HtpX [Nitrospira cf. moscoviensis SBR1015]OQW41091.1 MAG: heat-shock protein HtpX [Nitrospira sp. HN-bin3]
MKWLKGIGLFLIANFLIYITLSLTATLLVNVVLPAFGIDVRGIYNQQLLVWALVIGFGGAFISLAFSKQMARAMLSCEQITQPRSHAEQVIYGSVQEIAQRLHIAMPEVWIYDSPDPNAFATGPSKNNSMVAVSTGLLQNLREDEVKAVLAHEMGHVYNGDMFTTTVLSGLMNTFVYYISNFLSQLVGQPQGDREEGNTGNPILAFVVYIFLQVVLSFLAMMVVSWHSRRREFAADAFSAKVYGKEAMINALRGIDRWVNRTQFEYTGQDALATMKISGNSSGVMHLFATHPPIEARIDALQRITV